MPPIPTLEDQISALTSRLESVEARLAALEGRHPSPVNPAGVSTGLGEAEPAIDAGCAWTADDSPPRSAARSSSSAARSCCVL